MTRINIRQLFLAAAASLALLLVSCQRGSGSSSELSPTSPLQAAEALLESDPQAARAVLDSLLVSGEIREAALYAILRTQADYKCFVPLTSDSLIRIATDYYGKPRRPHYHAAMAWYSLGCVRAEEGDDIGAVQAYIYNGKKIFIR